ncbi:hypothetical protein [Pseudomonas sp. MUP55]|nr:MULTISPECIES: hypothetical protein [unclassified Pseudomonas]WPN94679.1 hypothetical protein SC319_09985 [Pseudomonas sp. MUP56]WPO00206.1 hypothetical protein SC318_09985 [Pseudomonas sp. MUP55]
MSTWNGDPARDIFQDWAAEDITCRVRLTRQFAQALEQRTEAG